MYHCLARISHWLACRPVSWYIAHVRYGTEQSARKIMRISARNQLKGTIVDVIKGATTSHVRIDIGGGGGGASSPTQKGVGGLQPATGQAGNPRETASAPRGC